VANRKKAGVGFFSAYLHDTPMGLASTGRDQDRRNRLSYLHLHRELRLNRII
jgi:hypothetical protein